MRWSLFKDSGYWAIRRWNGKKYERLSRKKYRHIRNDEPALIEFVKRLNAPLETKTAVDFRHAFISPALMEEYLDWLLAKFPTRQQDAKCEFYYLKTHFLNFFISQKGIKDPAKWFEHSETLWAKYLLSNAVPRGTNTKRQIIVAANRFMGWLHKKRPTEIPKEQLRPISKEVFARWEQQRIIDGETRDRKYIPSRDWTRIREALKGLSIEPFAMLSYCYGLRRGEALGVRRGDVRAKTLKVDRQLASLTPDLKFKPVKGVFDRHVPHWNCSPAEAYEWVERVEARRVNAKTLWKHWSRLMAKLKLEYDFHDLRHTFITNALASQPIPRAVQEAAGHKDIQTTMGYAHVIETEANPVFKPLKSA